MIFRRDLKFHGIAIVALMLGAAGAAVPAADELGKAAAALDRGDGIAAEAAGKRALDAGTPRGEIAALIGEAELLQGDHADARRWLAGEEFSAATRQRGLHALGRLELAEGDVAAAARAFDQALASGPGSARLWVDIGRLRYRAGQHHLAVEASARAVATDPDEPRALEFEAQLARDSRGVVAAIALFEQALEKAPDDLGLLGEYAATLGEAGRHRDMLRVARRMVEIDPRHPRAYYLQAVLAARARHDDLARRLLARTQGAYDDVPAAQLLAGVLELRAGSAALSVERFDSLARRQPENAMANRLLGRALLANGEAREVIARYQSAADRPDASPYLLGLVGRALEQLGRRHDAGPYLDRSADARPTSLGPLPGEGEGTIAAVGEIRRMLTQGRTAQALVLARELQTRYPDSIDVEILSGDAALLAGEPASALTAYDRAAEVRRDFALIERMVAAQQMLGRDQAATETLSAYLAANPRSAPAALMLGRMLARRGDGGRAETLISHAFLLGGGSERLPRGEGPVAATLARLSAAAAQATR
jgi:tetratricopeptide (TPR) repeat protein